MAKRTILVDSARRELEKHGTETFPMTVNHDDLWSSSSVHPGWLLIK